MATTYNILGSQTVNGTNLQDRFYAFTLDDNLDRVRADATIAAFSSVTNLKTSATTFFTITGTNVQTSSDFYAGGEKNDFIYGSNLNDAIFFNNGVISGGIGSFSSIEQFEMGAGDDIIDLSARGASGVDYARNAILRGDSGNDTIIGGAGTDTIYGDNGDDLLFGWRGADTVYGGTGNDIIYGDDFGFNGIAGDDFLYGQAGNDILYGGARTDRLEGGDGNDTLYGGSGGDNLYGGADDDFIYGDDEGTSGNDRLFGDAGNDQLFGGAGNDEMHGGTGNDVADGGEGIDFIDGDSGVDTLIGGAGDDVLDGGTEADTAVYTGNLGDYLIVENPDGSFTITDTRGGSPDGIDTVRNVEFFQFSDGIIPAGVPNSLPVIASNGGGASASISIEENLAFVTTVMANDPESGSALTYSISGGADAALFTIDPTTGVVSFVTAPDFENPIDAGADNVYDVVVRATDGNGGFDEQALAIAVTDVSDGSAPVIVSSGGGASANITVFENSTSVATVEAMDPDGTIPTYAIIGGADAARFTINSQTGVLAFINAPDFENPTDAGMNNVFDVIVQASDGANFAQQTIAVSVSNINDNSPSITSDGGGATASISMIENARTATVVVASDPDGTALTYSIAGGADAALFAISPQTGTLMFITAPDFEVPGDADGNNIYDVIVQASDGTNVAEQNIAVTVANANDNNPIITTNGGAAKASINVAENGAAVTVVAAADLDGTTPAYSIAGGADAALFTVDAQSGALVFANAPDFETPLDADGNGIYEVIVRASDGTNFDDQALSITVTNVDETGRTITGSSGNNVISPTATNLALQTTSLNDTIFALAGNDTIDGGLGADSMEGGVGDDVYFVDQFSDDGIAANDDLVIELASAGTDLVNSTVSYTLSANVENLTLIGSAAINGTGNDLANTITGNGANNMLFGGAGADRLDGAAGADIMTGGADNDIYFVDTYSDDGIASNDDQVIEVVGGGVDTVNSSVSFVLAAEVENLILMGTGVINGVGNGLANTLTGNSAANTLSGLAGNDTINGNAGNDTIRGGDGNDTISGGTDNDALYGDGGADTLLGGAGNDLLEGGLGNDSLSGQSGSDLLIGGGGRDTLTGGTESDIFRFNFGDTTTTSTNIDLVSDFETGLDKIDLDFVPGSLTASAYAEGQIGTNVYTDAFAQAQAMLTGGKSVMFVAGTTDGWLFWDTNNDAVIDQSILLKGLGSLGAFDHTDIM